MPEAVTPDERKTLEALTGSGLSAVEAEEETGVKGMGSLLRDLERRGLVERHVAEGRQVWRRTTEGQAAIGLL